MALIVIPSLRSKRPWARIRARCEASFFIVRSKSSRCCSARGHTNLTLIYLGIGFTYRIVLKLSRGILYQTTFGRALINYQFGGEDYCIAMNKLLVANGIDISR